MPKDGESESEHGRAGLRLNRRACRPVCKLKLPPLPEGGEIEIYHDPDGRQDVAYAPEGTTVERPKA